NIQEGLFVGCVVAGIGLASRRGNGRTIVLALIACILFMLSFPAGHALMENDPLLAGGTVTLFAAAAGRVAFAYGLAVLEHERIARIAFLCLSIGLIGLLLAIAYFVSIERLREADPKWTSTLIVPDRYVGRVASWFLAVPLGLAVGGLLGRA